MKNKIIKFLSKRYQLVVLTLFLLLSVGGFFILRGITNKPAEIPNIVDNNNNNNDNTNNNNNNNGGDNNNNGGDNNNNGNNNNNNNVVEPDVFISPVKSNSTEIVVRPYYDVDSDVSVQEQAVFFYSGSYYINNGVNYSIESNMTFDVVSTMGGTVTLVEETAINGYVVEITHDNGIVTRYSSLSNVTIAENQNVAQGVTIGQAGESEFDLESQIHVHYEVLKDENYIDPTSIIGKEVKDVE